MAKGKEPGKGVRSLRIDKRVQEAADDLHAICDGVVIVAVKFSGENDSAEHIVRVTHGTRIAINKAIDMLCEYDESMVDVRVYDHEDDEDVS